MVIPGRWTERLGNEFGLQPLADDASALLPIGWPRFRKHVVGNFVGREAERVADHLGSVIPVVAVNRPFEKVGHGIWF
jgi:hypothetical protein